MKFTRHLKVHHKIILNLSLTCLLTLSLNARIGDSRTDIERRLLRNQHGVRYKTSHTKEVRDKLNFSYKNIFNYLPKGAEHSIYYKSDDGSKSSSNDIKAEVVKKKGKKDKSIATWKIPANG